MSPTECAGSNQLYLLDNTGLLQKKPNNADRFLLDYKEGGVLFFKPYIILILVFLVALGCSDNQTKPDAKEEGEQLDAIVGDGDGDGSGGGTDTAGGDDFVEQNPDEGDVTSIADLLKQCGGDGVADADPDEVVYEKTVKSLPITKNILIVSIKAQSTLSIKVTGTKAIQDTTVKTETDTALEFIGNLAQTFIDDLTKESSGATTFTNLPFSDYSGLGSDHEAWEGTLCTFVPATKVINNKGERDTVVEFDPPLPSSVSPRADASRYADEIGDERVFKNIKAIVKKSDHPDLDGVDEILGTVKVRKVAADATLEAEGGKSIDVNADIAYEVTYDFGSPEQTFAIGLPPVVTYYISHDKRDLIANLVDTKNSTTGKVIFVHDESLVPEDDEEDE